MKRSFSLMSKVETNVFIVREQIFLTLITFDLKKKREFELYVNDIET